MKQVMEIVWKVVQAGAYTSLKGEFGWVYAHWCHHTSVKDKFVWVWVSLF